MLLSHLDFNQNVLKAPDRVVCILTRWGSVPQRIDTVDWRWVTTAGSFLLVQGDMQSHMYLEASCYMLHTLTKAGWRSSENMLLCSSLLTKYEKTDVFVSF